MLIIALIIIVIVLAIIYWIPPEKKTNSDKPQSQNNQTQNTSSQNNPEINIVDVITKYNEMQQEQSEPEINESYVDYYYHKNLLSKHEMSFYRILKSKANELNWTVNCKTRLEDIIGTKAKGKKKMSDRGKIKSRHVDFTVLDDRMNILFCIELDDSSHSTPDTIESDDFKNELFGAVGLKLYRVQSGSDFNLKIDKIIQSYLSNW